jgi:8-oxo-dGTP pyrophosphatase MutT (NUDIX family)
VIDVDLQAIRARLSGRLHQRYHGAAERVAAIAAVLRAGPLETELLIIRRAERDGDPWSGHMALPGGHQHASDPDLQATAVRETLEEVGLDLRQHELLGALDEHAATAQGRFTGIVIAPFVFALRSEVKLSPNHEVAAYHWAPLGRMARGELDATQEVMRNGSTMHFQGYRVGDRVVWGLTHRVLQSLFTALQH